MNWRAEEAISNHLPMQMPSQVRAMLRIPQRTRRSGVHGFGVSPREYARVLGAEARALHAPLHGLGQLDPGMTAAAVTGTAIGWASLPTLIGVVFQASGKKKTARTFFVIAGISAAVGATAAVLAAQKLDETMKTGL